MRPLPATCDGCGNDLPESTGMVRDGDPLGCGCDGAWVADEGDAWPDHDDENCKLCGLTVTVPRVDRVGLRFGGETVSMTAEDAQELGRELINGAQRVFVWRARIANAARNPADQ